MRLNNSRSNSLASLHRCLVLSETQPLPVASAIGSLSGEAAIIVLSSIVDISAPPFRRYGTGSGSDLAHHKPARSLPLPVPFFANACFQINICEAAEN